jgi:hypothetical protein
VAAALQRLAERDAHKQKRRLREDKEILAATVEVAVEVRASCIKGR